MENMLQELLSLTKILIAVPTVSGDEKSLELAVEIVYQDLYDYHVKRFTCNNISSLLYYNTPEIPDRFKILLNTNLDVVPGKTSQFKPVVKDGKLYGRGSYDMKAATAAMILAYKEVAKQVDYPLGLQIVADEEIGGISTKYQIEQGVRSDFIIAATPTDLRLSNMSKGILWIKVKTSGKSAHSGSPWKGQNAIWKMKPLLDRLEKEFPNPKEESWVTTINLANIATPNATPNNIPDFCEMTLDIRYIPEDEKTIVDKVKSLMPKDFETEILFHEVSEYTPVDNPYFMSLESASEKILGKKPEIFKKHYGDAVRLYKPFGGNGACIGPTGGGAHADDEWVDKESINEYYKILKEFLLSVS